ncbi:MAG: hypothetical protein QNJ22_08480 [Desulfosarcinaceae bacterium]|nr:hypothetical protein [Desulfosarcinaceae bacterium]
MKMEKGGPGDEVIIDLLAATTHYYRQELAASTQAPHQLRMEILRRLELISHSLKGLLEGDQRPLFRP